MTSYPPPPQSTKKYFVLVIIAIAIIIALIVGFVLFQGIVPVHPVADVTLSPNNQVIVASLAGSTGNSSPSFNVAVAHNINSNLLFPCSLTLYDNYEPSIESIHPSIVIQSDGTYNMENVGLVASADLAGTTVSYHVVLQDSNGNKVTSNTVTVEYK
jgi:hypothetical protein